MASKKVLRHAEIDFYQISTQGLRALGDPRCKSLINHGPLGMHMYWYL
jgi:hypothetical protein